MSKFFKALEQAERERALREEGKLPRGDAAPGLLDTPVEPAEASTTPLATRPSPVPSSASLSEAPPPGPAVDAPPDIDPHLVSLLEPGAMEAEPYRALRHLVEQRRPLTGGAVLVVTSPASGDGKTTTAINLAGALAQDPKARILLIEADLRSPALGARLGFHGAASRGLVDAILDSRVTLEGVIEPCPPFNLDILRANRHRGAHYELLASPRFAELIGEARRRYDYVLIDSPPLVPFPDSRILGATVDGYLLVVSAGRTPRKVVEEALGLIDPAKLVGLVFNGEERSATQYYYPTRGPASPTVGGNGHASRGWFSALLPRRRARRDRAQDRELWS